MNKAFEKILERLEELQNNLLSQTEGDVNLQVGVMNGVMYSKKIVQEVAEEYNGGWIPCSEEMPAEHDSTFAIFKGTDKWKNAMFEKTSDVVNVTVIDEYGNEAITHAHTIDGKWKCDLLRINKSYQIIAWKPLPEPFKERD